MSCGIISWTWSWPWGAWRTRSMNLSSSVVASYAWWRLPGRLSYVKRSKWSFVAKLVCSGFFCWGYGTCMYAYGTNAWFYWCYVSLYISKCQEPIYSAISKCVEPIYAFVDELCSVLLSSIVPTICSKLFPCLWAAITATIQQTSIKIRTQFIGQRPGRWWQECGRYSSELENWLVHDRKDYWNQGIHEIGIIRKWWS
jgi:hypothetical protein